MADLVTQRELSLEGSVLDYRSTLTGLQVRALNAALSLQLAEESVALAEQSAELAEGALDATRRRFERGAATGRDLRDAEANVREAQNFSLGAVSDLELARLSRANLVGDVELPVIPELPLLTGVPLEVRRADINLRLARLSLAGAERDLIPVAQADYTWNVDNSNTVGVTLESRTLQPGLSYNYDDPGRSPGQSATNGAFQIGVSLELSPGTFRALEAAEAQVMAAEAALQAAREGAAIERESLERELAAAQRALELAELRFRNAQRDSEETQTREELGLTTSLETLAELVDLLQADLELRAARQEVLSDTLAFYTFYAVPPSEVFDSGGVSEGAR